RKALMRILDDQYIRIERFDAQMIYSAFGYNFYMKKKWDKSIEWYQKILVLYPQNLAARQMITKNQNRKAGKKN
ncbi:MAG: hypothetical protein J5700_03240, partial [Treponema sp.]|nr:hypothetical protein [Treponema sp.]